MFYGPALVTLTGEKTDSADMGFWATVATTAATIGAKIGGKIAKKVRAKKKKKTNAAAAARAAKVAAGVNGTGKTSQAAVNGRRPAVRVPVTVNELQAAARPGINPAILYAGAGLVALLLLRGGRK